MSLWACAAPLQAVLAAMPAPEAWWTAAEAARHQAFSLPARRQRYLAGRWLARWLLAQASGGEALALRLDGEGAPRCAALPGWALSLSHSGDWLAAAAGEGAALGLDIEQAQTRRDWRALAAFIGLQFDEEAGFYRHWTLGEAWVKAQQRRLDEAAALRWQSAVDGEVWQAQDPERGLHGALWAPGEPRWLAFPDADAPQWRDAARWRQSTPKSK